VFNQVCRDLLKHILETEKSFFGITARDLRKFAFQVKLRWIYRIIKKVKFNYTFIDKLT